MFDRTFVKLRTRSKIYHSKIIPHKDPNVDLKTDSSKSSRWKMTKSDMPIPNLPLRSLSDVKTGFWDFLGKLSDDRLFSPEKLVMVKFGFCVVGLVK